MQLFGLIGLLVTLILTAWLFTLWLGPTDDNDDYPVKTHTYNDAIDAAEEAASQLGRP